MTIINMLKMNVQLAAEMIQGFEIIRTDVIRNSNI